MGYLGQRDYLLAAAGLIPGWGTVQKFGEATGCDTNDPTDIWSRANSVDLQKIWIAPTQAQVHNIVSGSALDAFPSGLGARTLRVFGLQTWDSLETSEVIELNGLTPVPTLNSYVIIHRMQVLTSGVTASSGGNVGKITATAAIDGTVTAQIEAGIGQTLMAIYGVPSVQVFFMTQARSSLNRGAATQANVSIVVCPDPVNNPLWCRSGDTYGLGGSGTSALPGPFEPPKVIPGPCIVKARGVSSQVDADISASFGGILMPTSGVKL
jgi:hypothetical protein